MVSRATLTPVRASISTPVLPDSFTVHRARTAQSASRMSKSMEAWVSISGWHRGISSQVRFTAWIPATRATPSTSPLAAVPSTMASSTGRDTRIVPSATAARKVGSFPVTSTITALPASSK